MHCKQFLNMQKDQQDLFISKLNHAVTHNDILFAAGKKLIEKAEEAGVFEDVKFGAEEVFKRVTEPTTQY
jgi:hypothetical protein